MIHPARWMAAAFAAAVLTGGCKGMDDGFAPAVQPKPVTFSGKVDPRYAGNWKTANGDLGLSLGKSGDLSVETVSYSVKGKSDTKVSGQWAVDGNDLLFRYLTDSKREMVLKYKATLANNTLTLVQGRIKTVYRRK